MTSYPQPGYSQPTTYSDPSTPATSSTGGDDPSMKEKASEAVDQGRQAAGQVAQSAAEHAHDVTQEAVRQARDLVGEARQHVTQQAGDQHQNLVHNLRSLSSELGSMVDRSENSGTATELVSQARERVDGVAEWLDGRQPGEIVDELRSFARRRPGTFLLGALAAGVVVGRLTRGAVAAHTDDGSSVTTGIATGELPAPDLPTTLVEPAGGYAHTTGPAGYEQTAGYGQSAGYEQQSGSAAGYSSGGGYGAPAGGPAPDQGYGSPEQGYGSPSGSPSTYGEADTTQAYPADGFQNGAQR